MSDKKNIKSVAYTFLIGDLLHFGHLRLLQQGNEIADYHISGIISDDVANNWIAPVVCNYEERNAVVASLDCVDETILQDSMDPTANLKLIHERFPKAKIIFFTSHQDWKQLPGVSYIESIGGELVKPEFYPRLSRDSIINAFVQEAHRENSDVSHSKVKLNLGNIIAYDEKMSTKANTLHNLKPLLQKASIEPLFILTVEQWQNNNDQVIESIQERFTSNKIVVRSSSLNEDLLDFSNAGAYTSVLNVHLDSKEEIKSSIEEVIAAYHEKSDFAEKNQVLVQSQTEDVMISGVVFTRNPKHVTPYYLINYDDKTSSTESVTSGMVSSKIEIFREIKQKEIPSRWRGLIVAIREIEDLLSGMILDIEFAIRKNGEIIIFQVRPLTAKNRSVVNNSKVLKKKIKSFRKSFDSLDKAAKYADEFYLSDMAFWNPAEIIGDHPNYLDYSLYNFLILKDSWIKGLTPLGYSNINHELMVLVGSKPYINVQYAFASLIPEDLSSSLKRKLLNYYNSKLKENPELHDKVEFDIVHNCYHFNLSKDLSKLEDQGFSKTELAELEAALKRITINALSSYKDIIEQDLKDIKRLESREELIEKFNADPGWRNALLTAKSLLEDCRKFGTIAFSRIARLAFMGRSLMESLNADSNVSANYYNEFVSTISTVASELDGVFSSGKSLEEKNEIIFNKFGHLRPGTYDITHLPYRKNPDYFDLSKESSTEDQPEIHSTHIKKDRLDELCAIADKCCTDHQLPISGKELLDYVESTTRNREYFKFEFSKNLSEALELIAYAGEKLGFSRQELSQLDYSLLFDILNSSNRDELINAWKSVIRTRKKDKKANSLTSLPPIIFSKRDFVAVSSMQNAPNFITNEVIMAEIIDLENLPADDPGDPKGKIVVIEKADPGFDWIFTKHIAGLITKYGGAASHMAIRCSEFNIPAAIGCGDQIFANALKANKILLNCKDNKIKLI